MRWSRPGRASSPLWNKLSASARNPVPRVWFIVWKWMRLARKTSESLRSWLRGAVLKLPVAQMRAVNVRPSLSSLQASAKPLCRLLGALCAFSQLERLGAC